MKRLILIGIMLMLSVGVAYGGPVFTDTVSATGGTTAYGAVGFKTNQQPTLTYLQWTASDADADVVIYQGDTTSTTLANAVSAAATALTLTECGGLDDSDILVIQNTNGDPVEAVSMSACNDTTNVATVSALANSYRTGGLVYEMVELITYSDVGTGTGIRQGRPILGGLKSKPLAVSLDGVSGTATIDLFTVEMR